MSKEQIQQFLSDPEVAKLLQISLQKDSEPDESNFLGYKPPKNLVNFDNLQIKTDSGGSSEEAGI